MWHVLVPSLSPWAGPLRGDAWISGRIYMGRGRKKKRLEPGGG